MASIPAPAPKAYVENEIAQPRVVARMSYQPPAPSAEAHPTALASRVVTVGLIASLLLSVAIAVLGR